MAMLHALVELIGGIVHEYLGKAMHESLLLIICEAVAPANQGSGGVYIILLGIINQCYFVSQRCFSDNPLCLNLLCGEVGGDKNIPVCMPYLIRQKTSVPAIRQRASCWL